MTTQSTPGPGHNSGTPDGKLSGVEFQAEQIKADLDRSHADIIKRAAALLAGVERAPVEIKDSHFKFFDPETGDPIIDPETGQQKTEFRTAEDWSERFADMVRIIGECGKAAEAARTEEKAPYLNAGRVIDNYFNAGIIDRLKEAADKLKSRQTIYLRKKAAEEQARRDEEARKAKEEADRLQQLAEQEQAKAATAAEIDNAEILKKQAEQAEADKLKAEKEASASMATLSRTRTMAGTVTGLKEFWTFTVDDYAEVDLNAIRPYLKQDAIEAAIRAAVTKFNVRTIKGVNIFKDSKAR